MEVKGTREDLQKILDALPRDGRFRTNREVRDEIGLAEDEDRYWKARDQLVNQGKIIKARGRGGSVAIATPTNGTSPEDSPVTKKEINKAAEQEASKAKKEIKEEYALYEPCKISIERRAKDEGAENTVVEITARQGSRQTGGEWSRPDVCQISVRNLRYWDKKSSK